LSQTPTQVCPQCQARVEAGQRFCPNCGNSLPQQVDPTVIESSYQGPSPSNPNYGTNPTPYGGPPSNPNYGTNPTPYGAPPSNPNFNYGSSPNYAPTPSPYGGPPSNPNNNYVANPYPNPTPNSNPGGYAHTQYAPQGPNPVPMPPNGPQIPYYNGPQSPQKKSGLSPIVIGIIALLVIVVLGGGIFALSQSHPGTNNGPGGNGGGNGGDNGQSFSKSQPIDLTITYASDQLTFTSLQQDKKFADDSFTSYGSHPNYVRLNFKEQQTAKNGSYFIYDEAFSLLLPDKSVVKAQNAHNTTGPDQSVVRDNWVDFPTDKMVDLSKLTLRLGTADEAQMEFPLKSGAGVTQFQPITLNPNTQFKYADMGWTLKTVTQSYYYNGKQAKTGQVYLTVELTADNNTTNEVYLTPSGFLRLKAGTSTLSPDDSLTLENYNVIQPNTTNIQGSATFLVTPTSDNKYTLDFQAGQNINEQTVDFTVSK